MMSSTVFVISAIATLAALTLFAAGWAIRVKGYGKYLHYNPSSDYPCPFERREEFCRMAKLADGAIKIDVGGADTVFLELKVKCKPCGFLFDPSIEVGSECGTVEQYFERRANGRRYVNVSNLVGGLARPVTLRLRGRHLTLADQVAGIWCFKSAVEDNDTIVIVAPHPDDAELAAAGFYADRPAKIVTLSAGQKGCRFLSSSVLDENEREAIGSKLRTIDSLTASWLGGISPLDCVNFGYPDGLLAEMRLNPCRDFAIDGELGFDFHAIRRVNVSDLISKTASCAWHSLVDDLAKVFRMCAPSVILAPDPFGDGHSDHRHATLAVFEAVRAANLEMGKYFFYVNHCMFSELFPFGPEGTAVSIAPGHYAFEYESAYSYPLTPSRRQDKFFSLESHRDLRNHFYHRIVGRKISFREAWQQRYYQLIGFKHLPTSFMRRALRSNELFYVCSVSRTDELHAALTREIGNHTSVAMAPGSGTC